MKSILVLSTLFIFVSCKQLSTEAVKTGSAVSHAGEEAAIKKAVDDAYNAISFKKGVKVDYDGIRKYFMPQAQFFEFRNDSLEILTINQFVDGYKNFIESNSISSFYEEEIKGSTDQFGRIAQRISTYRTYINTLDSVSERGVNSFQLIRTPAGWKVSSIIWDVESPKLNIPEYYLKTDSIH
jgi:hypothetical protein